MKKRVENKAISSGSVATPTKFMDKSERLALGNGDLVSLKVSLADKVADYLRERIF